MIREARHLDRLRAALVVAMGERNAEYLRRGNGIFSIGFVKIAATKQQNGIRVFGLEVVKLLHHRGLFAFCHCLCVCPIRQIGA